MAGRPEHARDSSLQDERRVRAELTVTAAIKPTAKELAANPRSRRRACALSEKFNHDVLR